jgi:hypothetical protein
VEALALAQKDGVLFFATLHRFRSWIITDKQRVVAQARRLDGQPWEHLDGAPKAWTLRGSCALWPVNAVSLMQRPAAMLVEGGGDLLSAFHLIWSEDRHDITPLAMLGASTSLHQAALPLFAAKRVRIYSHTDACGIRAAVRWAEQLKSVCTYVDCFDFCGLVRSDGKIVGDLNDFLLVDYDQWEQERMQEVLP